MKCEQRREDRQPGRRAGDKNRRAGLERSVGLAFSGDE